MSLCCSGGPAPSTTVHARAPPLLKNVRYMLTLSSCPPCLPTSPPHRTAPHRHRGHHRTEGLAGFGYSLPDTANNGDVSTPAPTTVEDLQESNASGESTGGSSDGADNSWWVAAAAGAGVGLGVVLLGALLFTKYGKKKEPGYGGMSKASSAAVSTDDLTGETKAEPAA